MANAGRGFLMLIRPGAAALAASLAIWATVILAAPATAARDVRFGTPGEAVDALVAAVRAGSTDDIVKLLGPGSRKLISSGDKVADRQARGRFLAEFEDANEITSESAARAVLVVGKDGWRFPFPIVKDGGGWRFDSSAGADEILDRRIGANELDAIEVCHAYVAAQREYAERDRNGNGFLEYAQKFLSSPDRHDGLYWPAAAGEDESPLGPLMASARAEGYGTAEPKNRRPYHGYYYRILKGQGPAARGGAYSYIVNGRMVAGFALVAFPAQYGASGIMTFIVNHDDIVYQKDLGPHTAKLAAKMTVFDPDPSWKTP